MAKLGTKGPKPKNPFDIKKFGKKDKNLKITWQPKIVEAVASEGMKDALKIKGKPHSSPEGRFMSKIRSKPLEIRMENGGKVRLAKKGGGRAYGKNS
jgi:hypothetical protein